ncbi:hypothetical protein N431DRAFT_438711 [Stipitochalara longipes BDJ]|nr:hypothetical protein N431DRAFT_438711 [Stipitochalara longipes BDJ]
MLTSDHRRVFPEHDWQNYPWDPADPSITYKSFVEGVNGKNKPNYELTDNLILWHFPKRGNSPSLDKVLDCLELGAHDALMKGYLHKLNLSIARVDDGPITEENLIESYTIKFSYESGIVTSRIYSEIGRTKSDNSGSGILTDVKTGARKLIDNVAGYLWNSSKRGRLKDYPLPSSFRMVMAMDYTDSTPSEYQAPRFRKGDEHASRLINLGNFDENYVLKAGRHSVAVGWHLPGVAHQSIQTRQHVDNGDPRPSQISHHVQNPITPRMRSRQNSMLSELEGGHTHPEAMRQIGGMGAFRQPNTETQDTRPLYKSSLPAPRTFTERRRDGQSQPRFRYPPYTQSILDFLNSQIEADEPEVVNCDCGAKDDVGDLVHCLKCGTSHHSQCHGYLDGSHPVYIMCYMCLLHPDDGPDEEELYQDMRRLCVKRRLLYYLLEHPPSAHIKQLSEYSSGDINRLEETQVFLAELELAGFVKIETGLLRDEDSMAFYSLAADEEMIRSNYFRPELKISHHFAVPEIPSSVHFKNMFGIDDPNGSQNPPLTAQNLFDPQFIARAAQRLLAEASSTQDTSSHPSRSRGSSRTFSSMGSPQTTRVVTPNLRHSSSNKKRTVTSDIDGVPPKRRHPGVNSPWIFTTNDNE